MSDFISICVINLLFKVVSQMVQLLSPKLAEVDKNREDEEQIIESDDIAMIEDTN